MFVLKKLTNFFKTNLIHKILPCLGVLLFIFNILLVGNVSASSVNPDFFKIDDGTMSFIYSTAEYKTGAYDYVVFYTGTDSWVVFFGKDFNVKGYVEETSSGVYSLLCPGSYNFPIFHNGKYFSYKEGIGFAWSGITGLQSTFDIYTDDSYSTLFYPYDVLYPYIYQDVGDIEYFNSGGIDIYPRNLF